MKVERRSLCLLACAFAILTGCQREAVSPTPDPEPEPEPVEPVVPDPPKPDPILSVRTLGAYQINGVDYTYQRGKHQMSRFYADGSLNFSLLDAENTVAYTISGINTLAAKDDTQTLRFIIKEDGKEPVESEFETTLLGSNGDTLWYKTAAKEYFVVKK